MFQLELVEESLVEEQFRPSSLVNYRSHVRERGLNVIIDRKVVTVKLISPTRNPKRYSDLLRRNVAEIESNLKSADRTANGLCDKYTFAHRRFIYYTSTIPRRREGTGAKENDRRRTKSIIPHVSLYSSKFLSNK